MKRNIAIPAVALLALAPAARAGEPPRDANALGQWALDSLHCRVEFVEQVQDRAFIDGVRKLGGKFDTEWVEGDLPEGELTLPAPVTMDGYPVTRIKYWADSGAEFYAFVAAPAADVAKALGAGPVPARDKDAFDDRTVGVKFTRKAKKDELLAPAIIVRKSETAGQTEVGCRYFDG